MQRPAIPTDAPEEAPGLVQKLTWEYPHIAATSQRAKGSISILSRQAALADQDWYLPNAADGFSRRPQGSPSGRTAGLAYHRLLQYLPPAQATSIAVAHRAAQELCEAGTIDAAELTQASLEPIVQFWTSDVGQAIRRQADRLHRELPFTARFTLTELGQLGYLVSEQEGHQGIEQVVIQGIIDLAVITDDEIWLLDFKSEQVTEADIPQRVREHAPQLGVYRLALQKIYRRPVTHTWIHFLQANVSTNPFP